MVICYIKGSIAHIGLAICRVYVSFYSLMVFFVMAVKKVGLSLKRHDKDTGSPEAQIENLTAQISVLQEHVAQNKKDFDAKRSLLQKVARRRRFLKYLKSMNLEAYTEVSKKTGLKV